MVPLPPPRVLFEKSVDVTEFERVGCFCWQKSAQEYQTKRFEIVCLYVVAKEFVSADSERVATAAAGSECLNSGY